MKELIDSLSATRVIVGGIEFNPFAIALHILLPIIGIFIVYRLLIFFLKRFLSRTLKLKDESCKNIMRILRWVLRLCMWIGWLLIITLYFGAEIGTYVSAFWIGLNSPIFSSGSMQISIITIILVFPIIYVAWRLTRRIMTVVDTKLLSRLVHEKSLRFSILSLSRYLTLIVLLLLGLTVIGIDLSSVTVLLGVLGIGIGFGLQGIVANFFAGLVIVFERPVKVGDRIFVNGIEGDVVKVRLRSTVINTLTNEAIVIPNQQLIENHVHNYSLDTPEIVIVNSVAVSYSSDLEKVHSVLLETAGQNPFLVAGKETTARVTQFGDSGISMELRTWINSAHNKLEAIAWTNMAIWKAFRQHNITIPFPQMDVHLKNIVPNKNNPEILP